MGNEDGNFKVNENIQIFIQKALGDEEITARMVACKSPEEAYAVASSVQGGFTMEEFVDTMQQIRESSDYELSEEDLAMAAGGVNDGDPPESASAVVSVVTCSSVTITFLAAAV